jgi:hypothetical protein
LIRPSTDCRIKCCGGGGRIQRTEANLDTASLSGALLRGTDLGGACWYRPISTGAELTGAYLSGADLSRANLIATKLNGANLSLADLTSANLSSGEFVNADLTGATLIEDELQPGEFDRRGIDRRAVAAPHDARMLLLPFRSLAAYQMIQIFTGRIPAPGS